MRKNIIFIIIASILIVSCCYNSKCTNPESWLIGNWSGSGEQVDGLFWEIVLKVDREETITVNYPDLGCKGFWEIVTVSDKLITAKETITEGVENCDQGVETEIRRTSKKNIVVTFFLKTYSTKPIATAKLKKRM